MAEIKHATCVDAQHDPNARLIWEDRSTRDAVYCVRGRFAACAGEDGEVIEVFDSKHAAMLALFERRRRMGERLISERRTLLGTP